MKDKLFSILAIIFCVLFLLFILFFYAIGILEFLYNVWDAILTFGRSSFLKGLVLLPLSIIGVVNLVRGSIKNATDDEELFNIKKTWKGFLYIIITICGYLAMLYNAHELFEFLK